MNKLLRRAEALHRAHPVVEGHTDIPMDTWRRRRAGEPAPLRDDYVKRLRCGGVRFQLLTVGGDMPVTMDAAGRPELRALEMIEDALAEEGPELRVVRTAADLDAAVAADQIGLVLHLEGCRPLEASPSLLSVFHRLGLRSVQPVWNPGNAFADGVGVAEAGGLTPRGRELVAELDRLGLLIDVSHLAEPGFWDLVELARGPIVASHANAKAVCPHPRNLSDEQIRAIAASGGTVGAVFVPAFIGGDGGLERLLDHVDHLVQTAGIDHVAIGPDYVEYVLDLMIADTEYGGGPVEFDWHFRDGLRRVETLPVFTAGLLGRGYVEADAAKIVGGNFLRVLRRVLPSG